MLSKDTGGCKINAHLVWRTRDVCSGGQEIYFWRSKFWAAPPAPRGYNVEGDRVVLLLQNKRSHLLGAPDTAPLSFVQRGAGGAPPNLERETGNVASAQKVRAR